MKNNKNRLIVALTATIVVILLVNGYCFYISKNSGAPSDEINTIDAKNTVATAKQEKSKITTTAPVPMELNLKKAPLYNDFLEKGKRSL